MSSDNWMLRSDRITADDATTATAGEISPLVDAAAMVEPVNINDAERSRRA